MKESVFNFPLTIGETAFLYNTFSDTLIRKTLVVEQCLNGNDANSKEVTRNLVDNGFLVEDDENEVEKVKTLRLQNRYSSKVYSLVVNLTLDCNLKCWYCYENHSTKTYIDDNVLNKILKHLELKSMLSSFEVLNLTLFGGEPMMNYKAMKTLLLGVRELAKRMNFKVKITIVTNGTLVSNKCIELLKHFDVRFQVTIDGDKSTHDSIRIFRKTFIKKSSYQTIINSLQLLNQAQANFYFTLRVNYDENVLPKIKALLADLNFLDRYKTVFCLQQVWQTSNDKIKIDSLLEAQNLINEAGFALSSMVFSRTYCNCDADNLHQAIINYDGKVFKCTARDFNKEHCYGNLTESGLIVWNTPKVESRLALKLPEKCTSCKLLPCCPGICSQKLLENKETNTIPCPFPFDKGMSINDIILFNVKQKLITKKNEKEYNDFSRIVS